MCVPLHTCYSLNMAVGIVRESRALLPRLAGIERGLSGLCGKCFYSLRRLSGPD